MSRRHLLRWAFVLADLSVLAFSLYVAAQWFKVPLASLSPGEVLNVKARLLDIAFALTLMAGWVLVLRHFGLYRHRYMSFMKFRHYHFLELLKATSLGTLLLMAASFMATTAVLLIFGILNLLANADKLGVAFHGLNSWGSQEPGMTVFKLMLIVVSFFVAFFAFALAVRGYHHAGYLINVPANGKRGVVPQKTVQVLNRASLYYMAGMRAYYFTVPLVLWMFGPVWLFVGTVALLLVLHYLDHLPD